MELIEANYSRPTQQSTRGFSWEGLPIPKFPTVGIHSNGDGYECRRCGSWWSPKGRTEAGHLPRGALV